MRGPIRPGPRTYVRCTTCSRLLSTKEKPVNVGVPTRHAAKHLEAHRLGKIRRPVEA